MRTRFARVLGFSAALLPLTFIQPAPAQSPGNVGRQVGGQILNNVGNAAVGQPAAVVPAQPVVPGQPAAYGVPATPRQMLQGIEAQAVNNATSAVTGQPATSATRYQLPAQFATSAPGTTVTYAGANYVVNADRTMSPTGATAQPAVAATRYQIPAQFAGTAPGTTVTYGGTNYVINNNNTMSPVAQAPGGILSQPLAPAVATSPRQALQGMERQAINRMTNAGAIQAGYVPTSAVRYQIPAQFAASAPGTTVSYRGANYVINANGTMSPAAAATPAANAVRYQIPGQFAGSAPGTNVTYGGANYVINNDNTMSPAAR